MTLLTLSRGTPLTPAEIHRLPPGVEPVSTGGAVVARARVDLPPEDVMGLAFELGRAFPDTVFGAEVEQLPATAAPPTSAPAPATGAGSGSVPPAGSAASAPSGDSQATEGDPWKLLHAGRTEEAIVAFTGFALDDPGRTEVRAMFIDRRPEQVVLGCRIATVTGWKAAATNFRSLLHHQHPDVREAALLGIAKVAGPSMGNVVKGLTKDPDPRVRKVAEETLKQLGW